MEQRPTLTGVLADRHPERAVTAQLDTWETAQRTHLKQEAEQQAAHRAQEASRARLSRGPSMG